MKAITRIIQTSLVLVLALAAIGISALGSDAAPGQAARGAAVRAVLPLATCSPTCDLYAATGSVTMPDGAVVPVWGFTDVDGGAAQLPGPALIVNEGERVEVTLHNQIPGETVSLALPGQEMAPDLIGIGTGLTSTYVFTPTAPGTFSYEAGLTPNGARQVAMGLYGALVVRPAMGASYIFNDANSQFDDEALLVFNEIDPAFNADPYGFSMQNFKAKYWLINGESFPETAPIATAPGNRVALRYLNAGVRSYSIGLLGLHQTILGTDGNQLPYSYEVVAESFGAGQSLDALVTIPGTVVDGTRYALYNAGRLLHNAGALASSGMVEFGGILTFIEVTGGAVAPDAGPLASAVTVNPDLTAPTSDVVLSATLDESSTGGSNVVEWEYFINGLGAPGTGITETLALPSPAVDVAVTLPAATLATLPAGDVTFYVRGMDANGNWGAAGSTVLDLVAEGPVIRGMVLTPVAANGTRDVALRATADDTPTGEINVVAAEFFFDALGTPGTGTAMTQNKVAPLVAITANIPAATVNALSEGYHTIYIHAQDALGNWGAPGTIDLMVDKTGPSSAGLSALPSPNNGTLPVNTYSYAVRLSAVIGDQSNIEKAEGFIDYEGPAIDPDGSGFPLLATDGLYNATLESVYVDIPLTTVRLLSEGPHVISFHGKDVAGNWGAMGELTLIVDKTGPSVSTPVVLPNPTAGASTVALVATITDPAVGAASGSNVAGAEWFVGLDPGQGFGTALPAADGAFDNSTEIVNAAVDISNLPNGPYTISVRARDVAGNWGAVSSTSLVVAGNTPGNINVNGFETGDLLGWQRSQGAVQVTESAAMDGVYGMQATLSGGAPAYVVDTKPYAETGYKASFLFNPNGVDTAGNAHDIFVGLSADGTKIFGVEFEQAPGGPEVRAWVRQGGVDTFTNWYHINDHAAQRIEIVWQSKTSASFSLAVDGSVQETLSGLDTTAYKLEEVWLGASANLTSGMTGIEYYDGFSSTRLIGNSIFLPMIIR